MLGRKSRLCIVVTVLGEAVIQLCRFGRRPAFWKPTGSTSDSNSRFVAGNRRDVIMGNQWRVIAVSQRGLSHESSGDPNQDYYAVSVVPANRERPETVIISVTDGAGSAPLSHLGSETVATVAVETLKKRLDSNPKIAVNKTIARNELLTAADGAVQALKSSATDTGAIPDDLATTMQLAIANDCLGAVLHIGDGRTVVMESGKFRNLSGPFNGEYANETTFVTTGGGKLTDNPGLDRQEISGEDICGIAVSTDGLDPLAVTLATDEPFDGFYKPIFQMPWQTDDLENGSIPLSRILGRMETRQKSPDDITVVIATRQHNNESNTRKDVK